jgi:hypothetical protein
MANPKWKSSLFAAIGIQVSGQKQKEMFLTAALQNRHVQAVKTRQSMKSSPRQAATRGLARQERKTAFAPQFVTTEARAIISRSNVSFQSRENGQSRPKKLQSHFVALRGQKSATKTIFLRIFLLQR